MSKIQDDPGKQKYMHSHTQVWEDGTELTIYSSKDQERMVIRHSSGSHMEFKSDGSVFIKAVKDLHMNSSVKSSAAGDISKGSEVTSMDFNTDLTLNVTGKLHISCDKLELEARDTGKVFASNDLKFTANNIIHKAEEQISLEGTKSIYMDSKELRESIVTRTVESGTKEGPGGTDKTGGLDVHKVMGNYVIQNDDPLGGITIKSAGYLNIVCGAERVDVTGDPALSVPGATDTYVPSSMGKATYTHIVKENPGGIGRGVPGSSYFECGPGGYIHNVIGPTLRTANGPTIHKYIGPFKESYDGPKTKNVSSIEIATIDKQYIVRAQKIFLN